MSNTTDGVAPSFESIDSLVALGWNGRWEALADEHALPTTEPARVLRHDGTAVLVGRAVAVGQVHLRNSTPPLAVGDWVMVDDDVVHHVLPRQSALRRRDPTTGGEQLIAANIDLVGIVCGLDRPLRTGLIERYVAQTWDSGAVPLVVLTKADLAPVDAAIDTVATAAPNVDMVAVSAPEFTGIDELRHHLSDRTAVFIGESGAGKSTLINTLAAETLAETRPVRRDNKGRHTTTARHLHVLGDGCRIIDTPGMRALGLWTDTETIDKTFAEITELVASCRFRDCVHRTEPGCAVLGALASSDLSEERYASWDRQRREVAAAELRANPPARRKAERERGRTERRTQRTGRRRD